MDFNKIKKLSFYVPIFTIAGTLSFNSPNNILLAHAEEDEVLYEETEGNEQQEAIDEKTVVENTVTSTGVNVILENTADATAANNDNQAINADSSFYFDNTNYFPETDLSANPGLYIPAETLDEVDRKGLNPPPTPEPTPEPTPDPEVPNTPPTIPKMGVNQLIDFQLFGFGVLALTVSVALYKCIKRFILGIALANNRAMAEVEEELKAVDSKKKCRTKNKEKKLTK